MSTPLLIDTEMRARQAANGFADSSGMSAKAGVVLGKLFGSEGVVLDDNAFTLTNAAEERSFGMAAHVESLTIRQRSVKPRQQPKLPPPAEIEELFRSMQEEDAGIHLRQLSDQILAILKNRGSPRQLLHERFTDPTKRFLALGYAVHEARQRGAPAHDVERLLDLLSEAEASDGTAIRAGLNTVDVAAEFSADPAEGDRFRKVYRDAVIGYESFAATLDAVLTQFGDAHFEQGARLLLKGLAADLHAVHPSTQATRLNAILQDLYSLEAVNTLLIRCRLLVDQCAQTTPASGLTATSMTRDLLHITAEPYVTAYHFADIARKYGITDNEAQVEFFTGAMAAVRSMPLKIFRNDEARFKAIDAAQAALDALLLDDEVAS